LPNPGILSPKGGRSEHWYSVRSDVVTYAEVTEFGNSEHIHFRENADPVASDGQLLIEIQSAGINFSDIMARTGVYAAIPQPPFRPGFEVTGRVASVGKRVKDFSVGDGVAAMMLGGGGYATHAVIDADTAIKLPSGLDFDIAAALMVQGLTAYLVLKEAAAGKDDTVLISAAAGGLGSLAVQISKKRGARVVGLASEAKHHFVKALGADVVIDYSKPGWSRSVMSATNAKGVTVYLDSQADLEQGAASMAPFGRWFLFGIRDQRAASGPAGQFVGYLLEKNLTLRGYTLQSSFQHIPLALKDLFAWVADGSLKVDITRYPLRDAAKAQDDFAARRTTGKVVLKPFE
jgi:NADPH2:quinone reductase